MTQVPRLLTPTQAVQRLAEAGFEVSDETLRVWAKTGRVPAVRLPSGRYLFELDDVDAILGQPAEAIAPPGTPPPSKPPAQPPNPAHPTQPPTPPIPTPAPSKATASGRGSAAEEAAA